MFLRRINREEIFFMLLIKRIDIWLIGIGDLH